MGIYTPETYFLNPAHEEIARSRYYLKDEQGNLVEKNIFEAFQRVNNYLYQNDTVANKALAQRLCEEKKIIYAGRPLAQGGTGIKNLYNCFVLGLEDSREAISETQRVHFHVQAHGGGTGFNFSALRPSGSWCKGANARSSGPEGFITAIGYLSSNVRQGGNRSGANLGLLEDWHPGLFKFISKKSRNNWENIRSFAAVTDEARFSQWQATNDYPWQTFNVSVGISDKFMRQVKSNSDKPWHTIWKGVTWYLWDYIATIPHYLPNGEVVSTEVPITVSAPNEDVALQEAKNEVPFRNSSYLKLAQGPYEISAHEWFSRMCRNAWEDGCPGIIFMDMIRAYHNGEYFNPILSVNPCAEEPLPAWSVCCLSNLVLPEFVSEDGSILWDELRQATFSLVRALNHITDLNETGVEQIDTNALKERRIGLGTIGIHELLIRVSLRSGKDYLYSQEAGRALTKKVLKFIKHCGYEASIELAKEKGPFPAFEYDKFIQSKFMQQFLKERPDLAESLKKHGIANVTVLTEPPTGTTGTITGYSSGCEPYFAMAFRRNSNVGTYLDGCPSFHKWLEEKGINYEEYGFNLKELRRHKRVPKVFEEAQDIHWKDHLLMQAVFSEQVDSSVSKTINMPHDASAEDIMEAYTTAFDLGIKSTAVYRDGSKVQILETLGATVQSADTRRPKTIVGVGAPKRPDSLDCDIQTVSVKGQRWKVLVGLLHGRPYETFCFPEENIEISPTKSKGVLEKSGNGRYNLIIGEGDDRLVIKNIASLLMNDEHRMITRLLSANLRHGMPLSSLVAQLSKCEGDVTTFSKAMSRVLKKYITEEEHAAAPHACGSCGGSNLVFESGCFSCADCGYSKCD